MKPIFYFSLACLLAVSSCKKEEEDPTDPTDETTATVITCGDFNGSYNFTDNPDLDVDYIVDCNLSVTGDVTIAPGTKIQFRTDAGFAVQDGGSLSAIGTSSAPIVLEGESATAGSWRGVMFYSNDVTNRLEYVTVRHGGGTSFNSNDDKGNVLVYADGRLTMNNCTLQRSGAYGLNCSYSSGNISLSNNTFSNNALAPIRMEANLVHEIDGGSIFSNNGEGFVYVSCQAIDEEVTWTPITIPYRVHADDYGITRHLGVVSTGGLTLEAGLAMEFESDCQIRVIDGYLEALGTSSDPVTFMGEVATPGAWNGIYLEGNNIRNNLDHVEIAYAGGGELQGYYGAIVLWANTRLNISNSTIRDADSNCGINDALGSANLTSTNNTFINITTEICQ